MQNVRVEVDSVKAQSGIPWVGGEETHRCQRQASPHQPVSCHSPIPVSGMEGARSLTLDPVKKRVKMEATKAARESLGTHNEQAAHGFGVSGPVVRTCVNGSTGRGPI